MKVLFTLQRKPGIEFPTHTKKEQTSLQDFIYSLRQRRRSNRDEFVNVETLCDVPTAELRSRALVTTPRYVDDNDGATGTSTLPLVS